uniref:Putative metalloprotease n=1 Tax=Ixodes ricinus TaxID=34613 RepID=A0A0K8REK1_IXORI
MNFWRNFGVDIWWVILDSPVCVMSWKVFEKTKHLSRFSTRSSRIFNNIFSVEPRSLRIAGYTFMFSTGTASASVTAAKKW